MPNLIIRMKVGDTITINNQQSMTEFLSAMHLHGAIADNNGTWIPMDSISHIVPQVVPNVPVEMLQQVDPSGRLDS